MNTRLSKYWLHSDFLEGGGVSKNFDSPRKAFGSPKVLKRCCFGQTFCTADNFFFEKTGQKVFGHFLENFDKKIAFLLARAPPQSLYIGAKGAFRKILGSVIKHGYLKKVQTPP